MHVTEGDGVMESFGAMPTFTRPLRLANARVVTGNVATSSFQPLIAMRDDEPLIPEQHDVIVVAAPANTTANVGRASEEARVLAHPDVVAAIGDAIPDLEAWEKTL